jgi:hypothetical protein
MPNSNRANSATWRQLLHLDTVLYRAVSGASAQPYRRLKLGDIVRPPTFSSATLSRAFADRFKRGRGQVVTILVPHGTAGAAYIHPFPREQMRHYEALLMPGIRLRVLDATAGALVLEAIHERDDDPDDAGGE